MGCVKMQSKIRVVVTSLAVGIAALTSIKVHEGFRDKAYIPVPGDRPTIGYGSTYNLDDSPVKLGQTITRQEADKLFIKTINDVYLKSIKDCIKVPLYQNELDSYLSLTYNIGTSAFCKSTLVRKLNNYDYKGACTEILKWDKFKGKSLKGLTLRRQDEYYTCLGIKVK